MSRTPTVSIGLPVYNGERFLATAIKSVLRQDYDDFELILCDNASTDRTRDICEDYAAGDRRIRYHRNQANIGAAPNHNLAFKLARGKYFKWVAHDDECHREFLRHCVQTLEESPESTVLVYTQAELIDEHGAVTGTYRVSVESDSPSPSVRVRRLIHNIDLGTPMYGVMRSSALRKTRVLGSYSGADHVLLAEMAALGEIREVALPLLRKRLHPGRSMEAHPRRSAQMVWYDPRNATRRRLIVGSDLLLLEYLRGFWRLRMSSLEVLRCTRTVVATTQRERYLRWKQRAHRLLSGRFLSGRSSDRKVT
jgi:glycosyltransferase involved in cell wall biosynthesis